MRDVEEAGALPHRLVLGLYALVLHRHLPAGEGHEAGAQGLCAPRRAGFVGASRSAIAYHRALSWRAARASSRRRVGACVGASSQVFGAALGELQHRADEVVEGLLGLRLGRLYEHGLLHDEGEVDRGRVVAVVYEALGDVEGLLPLGRLDDDLVLAELVVGDAVGAPQPRPHVVGVQDGHVGHVPQLRAVHLDVVPGPQSIWPKLPWKPATRPMLFSGRTKT